MLQAHRMCNEVRAIIFSPVEDRMKRKALLLLLLVLDMMSCTRWPITWAIKSGTGLWAGTIGALWGIGMASQFAAGEYPMWLGIVLYSMFALCAATLGMAVVIRYRPVFCPELYQGYAQSAPKLTMVRGGAAPSLLKTGVG